LAGLSIDHSVNYVLADEMFKGGLFMNNERVMNFILLCVLVLCVGGCSHRYTYNYPGAIIDIEFSGNSTISVAVHDQRVYIKTVAKSPDFVGLQRGWFGEPNDVSTENGKPLAENMTAVISSSLAKKGFSVKPVIVSHADKVDMVMNKLTSVKTNRLVLLTIKEWKTDTKKYSKLIFNLSFKIFDTDKHILAEKNISSDGENIGTGPENVAPNAFKEKMESMINDPALAMALKGER
jgi:hypothetical protein